MSESLQNDCLRSLLGRLEGRQVISIDNEDYKKLQAAIIDNDARYKVAECTVPECSTSFTIAALAGKLTIIESDVRTGEIPCEFRTP